MAPHDWVKINNFSFLFFFGKGPKSLGSRGWSRGNSSSKINSLRLLKWNNGLHKSRYVINSVNKPFLYVDFHSCFMIYFRSLRRRKIFHFLILKSPVFSGWRNQVGERCSVGKFLLLPPFGRKIPRRYPESGFSSTFPVIYTFFIW